MVKELGDLKAWSTFIGWTVVSLAFYRNLQVSTNMKELLGANETEEDVSFNLVKITYSSFFFNVNLAKVAYLGNVRCLSAYE